MASAPASRKEGPARRANGEAAKPRQAAAPAVERGVKREPDYAHPPGAPAAHWTREEIRAWLERVRTALVAEGFHSTAFQYPKKGQMWGLVRDHGDDLQIHIRAFDSGVLESEVELHRRYLEHLVSPRRSAHEEVRHLLAKHGIETTTINEEYRTRTGADREKMPRTRTKVKHLAGAAVTGAAIAAVSIARMMRRRRSLL